MPTRTVPGLHGRGITFTKSDGYYFKINAKRGEDSVYVKCVDCNFRGKLVEGELHINPGDHSHAPDVAKEGVARLKQELKEEAKNVLGRRMSTVFSQTCATADPVARAGVSEEACKSAMYRARSTMHPPVPKDMEELQSCLTDERYSDKYRKCPDGSLMTRGLIGAPGQQSLVFTSDVMLNILVAAAWLFVDGNFAARPDTPPSRQLLVISALYQEMLFPVCFALMASKAEAAYRCLFSFLKDLAPMLSPGSVVTDFEAALVSPIRDLFPQSHHQGCWFHFCQALHRNLGFMGLIIFVKNNYNALTIVRMCYVLPLLPSRLMLQGLNAIEYVAHSNQLLTPLQDFLNYVRSTWLESIGTDRLSVYRSKHRTNNYSESGHKALQDRMNSIRPGTWNFINAINSELTEAHLDVIRVQGSQTTTRPRRAKWVRQDAKIKKWLDELDGVNGASRTVLEFLVAAQNVARSLQRTQFHISSSTPTADPVDYPTPLEAIDDSDKVPPQVIPEPLVEQEVVEQVELHEQAGPSSSGTQGTQATEAPMPLLMPPAQIDFAVRLVLPNDEEDLFASQEQPGPARSPVSPVNEPNVSPVRGQRRGRPRLFRPAGAAEPTRGRPVGRPRGSRGRGGRGRGGRGPGRPRGSRAGRQRSPSPALDRSSSPVPLSPPPLPEEFMTEDEVRTRRQHQMVAQQRAATAAAAAAAAAAGDPGDCVVCYDHVRSHLAAPCGHKCICGDCAERLRQSASKCPICNREVIFYVQVFD